MAASENRGEEGKRMRIEVEEAKGPLSSVSNEELTILKEVCEAQKIFFFLVT